MQPLFRGGQGLWLSWTSPCWLNPVTLSPGSKLLQPLLLPLSPPPLSPARPTSFHGPKGHKQQTMMCNRIFLNVGKLWEAQQEASENG